MSKFKTRFKGPIITRNIVVLCKVRPVSKPFTFIPSLSWYAQNAQRAGLCGFNYI